MSYLAVFDTFSQLLSLKGMVSDVILAIRFSKLCPEKGGLPDNM